LATIDQPTNGRIGVGPEFELGLESHFGSDHEAKRVFCTEYLLNVETLVIEIHVQGPMPPQFVR
jgi:hypothetical protein